MRRISVKTKCVADQYVSDPTRERIVEFFDPVTKLGGLISFRRDSDACLRVEVYRCDPGVTVNGSEGPR